MKKTLTALLALAMAAFSAAASAVETVRICVVACAEKAHDALFTGMARMGLVLGMAEFNSRQITGLTSAPKTKMAPYDDAQIRVFVSTTPAAAAWAQNDTFKVATIPKGTRILRSGKVYHGAFGAGVTMDVGFRKASDGTVVDADGIATALNVAAAGVKDLNGGSALAGVATATIVAQEDWDIYATLGGANPTDDIQAEFELHLALPTP